MAASVILNEQKVIGLLSEFINEAELEPCGILANEQDLPQVPKVITSLHNEIVAGNWSKALQVVKSLAVSDSDLSSMKYSILKQQYLESINTLFSSKVELGGKLKTLGKDEIIKYVNPEQLKLVAAHLKSLEGLCSQEDYFKLSFLISCPDLKTHPSYSNWTVESGRRETASNVCQEAVKLKYPALLDNHRLCASKPKRSNRLLQLVAKGILYEKCEKLLQHQAGSHKEYKCGGGEILDVHSWLARLPDEVFQIPIHKLSLCIKEQCRVKSGCDPSSPVQQFVDSHSHVAATASAVSSAEDTDNDKTVTKPENGTAAIHTQDTQEVMEDERKTKGDVTDEDNITVQKERHQNAEEGLTKFHVTEEIHTHVNGYDDNLQQPQKIDANGDLEKRDVYTPENCHIEVQPVISSSTPKPSHGKHTVDLLVTSPIDRDEEAPDYGPYHTPTSLRKQVMTKNRSKFPRYTLVGTISEAQAVRAVAFEPAGQFVAIGANSKSLRICSLAPILQPDDGDDSHPDLPVLYHHPKYHKGSVYCLTWNTDGVMASGSNDQTIRLLKFDQDTSTVTGTPEDVHLHKGTVRDVVFLNNGYLSSAGAGDCAVKVYDCVAQRCIRSFASHSSQVLALSPVLDNVNLILSAGHDQNLILWDVRQPDAIQANKFSSPVTSVTNHIKDVCISLMDGSLSFLDLRQLSVKHQLQYLHRDECRSVCYSPNGNYVLSGSYEGKVQLTDAQSKLSNVAAEHTDKVVQCRWHCDSKMFASTSVDKRVCFWQE